jgi:hypothetical protein
MAKPMMSSPMPKARPAEATAAAGGARKPNADGKYSPTTEMRMRSTQSNAMASSPRPKPRPAASAAPSPRATSGIATRAPGNMSPAMRASDKAKK